MAGRAPAAIWAAANRILNLVDGAEMSGIVGDPNHSYGYHLARRDCRSGDYSTKLQRDRNGASDAASALDIKLPPGQMRAITARLDAAARAGDPRLAALREFAGTLDGRNTYAYDLSKDQPAFGTWDDSHLWHIHLSGYREAADDYDAWNGIADVFIGEAAYRPASDGAESIDGDISGGIAKEEDDMANYLPLYIVGMEGHARANDVGGAYYLVNDNEATYTWISPAQLERFRGMGLQEYGQQGADIVGGYRYIGPGDYEVVVVQPQG